MSPSSAGSRTTHALTDAIAREALAFQSGSASDDIAIVTFAPRTAAGRQGRR